MNLTSADNLIITDTVSERRAEVRFSDLENSLLSVIYCL